MHAADDPKIIDVDFKIDRTRPDPFEVTWSTNEDLGRGHYRFAGSHITDWASLRSAEPKISGSWLVRSRRSWLVATGFEGETSFTARRGCAENATAWTGKGAPSGQIFQTFGIAIMPACSVT